MSVSQIEHFVHGAVCVYPLQAHYTNLFTVYPKARYWLYKEF